MKYTLVHTTWWLDSEGYRDTSEIEVTVYGNRRRNVYLKQGYKIIK